MRNFFDSVGVGAYGRVLSDSGARSSVAGLYKSMSRWIASRVSAFPHGHSNFPEPSGGVVS